MATHLVHRPLTARGVLALLDGPLPGPQRRASDPGTGARYVMRSARLGGAFGAGAGAVLFLVSASRFWRRLALTDHMIGVGNRRAFDRRAEEVLHVGARRGRPVALIMLDIDFFKRLNDTLGHQAGDKALQQVGPALQAGLPSARLTRPSRRPSLARYGGEEFVVVLPGGDAAAAMAVAENLRARLAEAWTRSPITASAGVAVFPRHGTTPSALIDAADKALYASKQAGRDRTTLADDNVSEHGRAPTAK